MGTITNRQFVWALSVSALTLFGAEIAYGYPSRGGECAFCHSNDGGKVDIEGYDEILSDEKLFKVSPGGSTQFTFDATEKVDGRYGLVLRRLDTLNAATQYEPRLYTPDPDWGTAHNDENYVYWWGQYFSTGLTEDLKAYTFDLTLDPAVKPGLYTMLITQAGGYPSADLGWHNTQEFYLQVIPEASTMAMIATALGGVITFRRRRNH